MALAFALCWSLVRQRLFQPSAHAACSLGVCLHPCTVCLWMAFLLLRRGSRLFPGQCRVSAQWTLEALHSTYHPEAHSMHELWAHVCALAQASQAPGEAPGMRQSVRTRLGKETRVVVPVVCSRMSLCGALVLEAGGSLRATGSALHSLVPSHVAPALTERLLCVAQPCPSAAQSDGNVQKAKGHYCLLCRKRKNCSRCAAAVAASSGERGRPC